MSKIYEVLSKLLNQTDEKMYGLVWVGKNYSKQDLINDLEEVKEETEHLIDSLDEHEREQLFQH